MGLTSSKTDKNEALRLCKARRRFIKQAIDSRYAFAAAHVSYIQSLKNVGVALRRYAEAEVLMESSLSTTSATELEKTPSHSSYPSPSPSHINDVSDSPLQNEDSSPSPKHIDISLPMANLSYMRTARSSAVTVSVNANSGVSGFVEESLAMPVPPPPPPHFESGSWDYFDPIDENESFRFVGHNNGLDSGSVDMREWKFRSEGIDDNVGGLDSDSVVMREWKFRSEGIDDDVGGKGFEKLDRWVSRNDSNSQSMERNAALFRPVSSGGVEARLVDMEQNANGSAGNPTGNVSLEQSSSKREKTLSEKDFCAEREDPSEFITHRAKDFLSSIKDIEHRFFRASEYGRELSRMLEANQIRVGFSELKGRSSGPDVLAAFQFVCCHGRTAPVSDDPTQQATKVITWKRTTSSRSSSSKNPLVAQDDASDSGSDFVEDFCMIAGSHSSTLERLYAWELKLYDEVKASESIRKVYDQKCNQLRHQFAKDQSAQVIDKTRAVVKDLYSRIRVALQSVDSISRRIERMRDEELQPQLGELIQGLTRMWKEMLECHHTQYITISLAYHSRSSMGTPHGDTRKQVLAQLQEEVECFGLSFANWVNSLTSYVEALNSYLQNCILRPRERARNRRPFSPRRVLAPPIFVLCQEWSSGLKCLPSDQLSNDIRSFLLDLHYLMEHQVEQLQKSLKLDDANNGESGTKDDEKNDDVPSNLSCIHSSLAKVLDRLNKFSEASLKMYENIRQKSEEAHAAYSNRRPGRF